MPVKSYLTLCLFIKGEQEYLPEWLWWHRTIGVDRFIIIDNGGDIENIYGRDTTIIPYTSDNLPAKQCRAYDMALKEYGPQCHWMGFIDTDEFIVPRCELLEVLNRRHDFGGLGIPWKMFGSSGHIIKPDGVLTNFTRCSRPNDLEHIKSIVQPAKTIRCSNPHYFLYHDDMCRSVNGFEITGPIASTQSHDLIQINHYWTRSLEEWYAKCKRGRGDGLGYYDIYGFEEFNSYANALEDRTAANAVLSHFSNLKPPYFPTAAKAWSMVNAG